MSLCAAAAPSGALRLSSLATCGPSISNAFLNAPTASVAAPATAISGTATRTAAAATGARTPAPAAAPAPAVAPPAPAVAPAPAPAVAPAAGAARAPTIAAGTISPAEVAADADGAIGSTFGTGLGPATAAGSCEIDDPPEDDPPGLRPPFVTAASKPLNSSTSLRMAPIELPRPVTWPTTSATCLASFSPALPTSDPSSVACRGPLTSVVAFGPDASGVDVDGVGVAVGPATGSAALGVSVPPVSLPAALAASDDATAAAISSAVCPLSSKITRNSTATTHLLREIRFACRTLPRHWGRPGAGAALPAGQGRTAAPLGTLPPEWSAKRLPSPARLPRE